MLGRIMCCSRTMSSFRSTRSAGRTTRLSDGSISIRSMWCGGGDAFAVDRAMAVRKHVTFDTRENRLTKYMLTQTARRLEIFRQRFMKAGSAVDEKLDAEIDRMIRGIRRRYAGNFLSSIEAERRRPACRWCSRWRRATGICSNIT